MSQFVLVAETGSDIPPELAKEWGIYLVPMHVAMNGLTRDDGSFPVEEICDFYHHTGTLPKTSGCSPEDFAKVFSEIHAAYPDRQILHLAYSAVTTVSYQSALIAAENLDYVTSVDTKHVSAGQAAVVMLVAKALSQRSDVTLNQAVQLVHSISDRVKMCFMPSDLEYLRAGGRVSNATALGGRLLNLHPCIEVIDGSLTAKKKYRGNPEKVVPALIRDYAQQERLEKAHILLIWSVGLSDEIKQIAQTEVRHLGFESYSWWKTGCVITTHGGPGVFGMVGLSAT